MNFEALSTKQLQALLKDRGYSVSYRLKQDLIERLKSVLGEESLEKSLEGVELEESVDGDQEKGVSEGGDEYDSNGKDSVDNTVEMAQNNFVFKDVEDSLESFDGESGKEISDWIKDFEDIASVCLWNDIQRYLYARRLLKGAAKLAIESEKNINTWKGLKSILEKEFGKTVSGLLIHRQLESRRKNVNESYLEYMFQMKLIANKGNVDEESLLSYIVSGINDSTINKTILYEARTFSDLKSKFKIYDEMKLQIQKQRDEVRTHKTNTQTQSFKSQNRVQTPGYSSQGSESQKRCVTCGAKGHPSQSCPHKDKGPRCFNCNDFGHLSKLCPKKNQNQNSTKVNRIFSPIVRMQIKIDSIPLDALFDTGSQLCLIKNSVFLKLNKRFDSAGTLLTGIGQTVYKSVGAVKMTVIVDDMPYILTFDVVNDEWMSENVLIGTEILEYANMVIENGNVSFKRKDVKCSDEVGNDNHISEIDTEALVTENKKVYNIDIIQNTRIKQTIENMVKAYNPKKPIKSCVEMKILLEDEKPVFHRPRRLAPKEKNFVTNQISEWLVEGIVVPSNSNFASPVVLAKKKDGSYRLCVDYRKLNTRIVKDRYPLPIIEDILENLYSARVFTSLDLKNGFFHVDIHPESRKFTSFVTPDAQYEFCKVPFGLCNSPSVFQRFINTVFKDLVRERFLFIYMDDLIIPSENEEDNLKTLELVLNVAEKNGLIIKWEKCNFVTRSIEFLGHIVENGTVKPSIEKTKAVRNFPEPKRLKDLKSFLGLTGFFRKFIPNYSRIAKPLSDLTRKTSVGFSFGHEQRNSYLQLKELLCQEPVLKLFNPALETELHTDASKVGLAAVLLQRHERELHPVFYLSFKTKPTEEKYSSYELEVLAIIRSLQKLRVYLLGLKFKIFTDCKAFQLTMQKKELCTRVAHWALYLEEFDCTVHHKPGKYMQHVDALSRVLTLATVDTGVLHRIKKAQEKDETCQLILKILQQEQYEDYINRNGVLYRFIEGAYLLVVPKSIQREIVRSVHEIGHINSQKVETHLKQHYYFANMRKRINEILSNCVSCILAVKKGGKQEGFLNPITKVDVPLHTIHMDHLGPMPSTNKNYKHLLVIMDAFTKFVWIFPVKSTTTEEVLSKLVTLENIFGNPARVITDRGAAFSSNNFEEYCDQRKILHSKITTGVPRGNGQVERMNRIIIATLTKMSLENPLKWYQHITKLQKAINSTTSRATKRTPFELLFGVPMRNNEDVKLIEMLEEEMLEEFERDRAELRKEAKIQIEQIQKENSTQYNKKRKPARKYAVHDLVAIQRTQFGTGLKVQPKFLGPYEVTKIRRNDRYDVSKIGSHDGPNKTSTAADLMKPWVQEDDYESDISSD